MKNLKFISVATHCYNEEENVYNMYLSIKNIFKELPQYKYEHIFIDNCSTDKTAIILKKIAQEDKSVKVILNIRNFGPGRSGCYVLLQTSGDATISLACDFQDPPELIPRFIRKWEEGYKVVYGQKLGSQENKFMFFLRTMYYKLIKSFSSVDQLEHVTGFGLYDKSVIEMFRWIDDPNPYVRNTIVELGYEVALIQYVQPKRKAGRSSYNLLRYIDTAINGMMNSSRVPLRIATFTGFVMSFLSMVIAFIYLILKLSNWNSFNLGIAPLIIGMFFLGSIQIAFIGIIGEYIGAILERVIRRPLIVEKERFNFEKVNLESEMVPKNEERVDEYK